ncbi:MAG: chemotaxis protein CheD [Armatimonadota bacterium]
MAKEQQVVGMAEIKTAKGHTTYNCLGLGSCVCLVAYDPQAEISGMVHIMLPNAFKDKPVERKGKFADTGIAALLEEMQELGADPCRLLVAYAGGAQVFRSGVLEENRLDVGARNGESVAKVLSELKVHVVASDIGGNHGRTLTFCTQTGLIRVRTVASGERPLCNMKQGLLRTAA